MNPSIRWLYERVNYERSASIPYKTDLKLDRMRALCARLRDPQRGLPAVHIAGTKGKGSTAALVAGAIQRAGYRTGLFTSPHLERLEERAAVDGIPCSEMELADGLDRLRPHVEQLDREAAGVPGEQGPTFFEILTAFAFDHFRRRDVQLAVLEVGLGGRLDSTNVCEPVVTAITSISLDHTQQLGATVEEIAAEKGGIIKHGVPVVCGELNPGPRAVISHLAGQRSAPLWEVGRTVRYDYRPGRLDADQPATIRVECCSPRPEVLVDWVPLALPGRHQAINAAVTAMICRLLGEAGRPIAPWALASALAEVHCPARIELVRRRPWVILDGAHNPASVQALVDYLSEQVRASRRFLIFAAAADKDVPGMLDRLRRSFDETFCARFTNNPRAVEVERLMAWAASRFERVSWFDTPQEAYGEARRRAGPDDLICATGSFYLAAELRPVMLDDARQSACR